MAKPIVDHKGRVKGKKRKEVTFEEVDDEHITAVAGGSVRRVVFEGREPTVHEEVVETRHEYQPRHYAPIRDIEHEVDNLHKFRRRVPTTRQKFDTSDDSVYMTDGGGEVRSARAPSEHGTRRALYLTVNKGSHVEEKRFSEADVDRIIAGVSLEPTVEVITETTTTYVPHKKTVVEQVPVAKKVAVKRYADASGKLKKGKKAAKTPAKAVAKAAKAPAKKTAPAPYYDYKGDVHPVIEVEGIGPKYAKKLQAAGIMTTARLCYEDAVNIAGKIDAPAKTVSGWQAMSELAKVKGIGPQYAEALVRAGVQGIQELKDRSAATLAEQVNKYLDSLKNNVLGTKITAKRIQGWQTAAKPMRRVKQAIPQE